MSRVHYLLVVAAGFSLRNKEERNLKVAATKLED